MEQQKQLFIVLSRATYFTSPNRNHSSPHLLPWQCALTADLLPDTNLVSCSNWSSLLVLFSSAACCWELKFHLTLSNLYLRIKILSPQFMSLSDEILSSWKKVTNPLAKTEGFKQVCHRNQSILITAFYFITIENFATKFKVNGLNRSVGKVWFTTN